MNWANYTRPVTQVKRKQHNFLSSDLYTPLALGISVFILQIFLLTMPSLDLRAQEQDLKFSNISIEDGLSHSKVNCIYQDSNGFLWFGTNKGLNKYDGYQFTVYVKDSDNLNSISANLIRCILEDSDGNLWIGTESGGLNRYDRRYDTFSHFDADTSSEIVLSGNDVNSIIRDRQGYFWLGTDNGLDRLDWQHKKITHYLPYPSASNPQLSNEIMVVYEDRLENLWVGTLGGGLCLFDRGDEKFTYYLHDEKDPHSISDNEIRSIYEDSQGNLWIGTTSEALNLYHKGKKQFSRFYPDRTNPESNTIRAILDDGLGNLWIGNRGGLYEFDRKNGQFTGYTQNPNNPYSLVQNSVQTICKDAKGDLWIGTRGGISYLNTSNLPFVHYRADANDLRCLNKPVVYAILEDRHGDLWFSTEGGGVNHLNRKTGLFTYYRYDFNNPHSLSVNNAKALLEDRSGNLWVGTYNGGLNVLDRKSKQFRHYVHDSRDPQSIAIDNVLALLEDKQGNIWVGTYGGGLDRFDKKTGQFVHVLQDWHAQGFYNINYLTLDKSGSLWVAAADGRVGCLEPQSGEFRAFQLAADMDNVDVTSVVEDRDGQILCGTAGGGLYVYYPDENSFVNYSRQDGLASNTIYGILQDDAGDLWLSTTNGLCCFNPKTGKAKNYYKENGLQSDQFNYHAFLKTRSGELFFGGINGVTAFHPQKIRENSYIPPVVISDFKILNKPVAIGGKNSVLSEVISETKEIRLSYRHTVISFEFVALNFAISEQNQYAYMMEGFDTDWNYVGQRRFANYTNLDPGNYTFRVKAANNDGQWNEEGAAVKIAISSPFWKTLWFKFILVALVALIIKHFIDYLHQRKNLLKAKALANLAQLKLLRNQMNPHFLFNALGSIRSMILISKEKAWDMVSELSEFFRYSMLNFNKVDALLDDEINAVHNYLNIEKVRYKDSLQVSYTINDKARKCLVPAFLFQPLIENAIKYGMQTSLMPLQVDISISYQKNVLSIDVSNSGKIDNARLGSPEETDGHGASLENIRQRLEIMFKDRYHFRLFERAGWVHAKIRIECDDKKKGKRSTKQKYAAAPTTAASFSASRHSADSS